MEDENKNRKITEKFKKSDKRVATKIKLEAQESDTAIDLTNNLREK